MKRRDVLKGAAAVAAGVMATGISAPAGARVEKPSPWVPCCERDHNGDGNCDRHPEKVHIRFSLVLPGPYDKLADQLSHGMRQKVVLCCAFLHEPLALLLDEPLSGLDPRGIRSLYNGLERRAADGAAVILSSHLLGQIEGVCTRFLILQEGHRLFYGSKDEIRAELPSLRESASLEEIFFEATEGTGNLAGGEEAEGATP